LRLLKLGELEVKIGIRELNRGKYILRATGAIVSPLAPLVLKWLNTFYNLGTPG